VRYVVEHVTVVKPAAIETNSVEDVMVAAVVGRWFERAKSQFAVGRARVR
jgi:hypothetical protein